MFKRLANICCDFTVAQESFFSTKNSRSISSQKIETSFCAIFLSTVNGVYVELAD